MSPNDLDKEVIHYCKELVKKCNTHRIWARKMFPKWEYPAMAAVCEGCQIC